MLKSAHNKILNSTIKDKSNKDNTDKNELLINSPISSPSNSPINSPINSPTNSPIFSSTDDSSDNIMDKKNNINDKDINVNKNYVCKVYYNNDDKNKKYRNKKNIYCNNCGKFGHLQKKCLEPITSLGIITIKIQTENDMLIRTKEPISNSSNEYITDKQKYLALTPSFKNENGKCSIDDKFILCEKDDDIKKFCLYKNTVKFLMVSRKSTLGYIEFIRGRYELDNSDNICFLFEQMRQHEIKKIEKASSFDELWYDLWKNRKKNYELEYESSKNKFNSLKLGLETKKNLEFYVKNIKPKWNTPEWGFPKGRRNFHEKNIDCAEREFREESGLKYDEYKLLRFLNPLEEEFIGTNGIKYKHIYYIAITLTSKELIVDANNKKQCEEIGEIGWFTYEDAIDMIRPYHIERKKILTQLYLYVINRLIAYNKDKNIKQDKAII